MAVLGVYFSMRMVIVFSALGLAGFGLVLVIWAGVRMLPAYWLQWRKSRPISELGAPVQPPHHHVEKKAA
jgi:hypothetical protein